jgi:hypothetical protein
VTEIGKGVLLIEGTACHEEEVLQDLGTEKTVMVYLLDKNGIGKEPVGVILERRKSERDDNNAIGMLRLARKEFAKTEEEAQRIIIGAYL